jgi:type VI secretion system secreted protein Hcp
MRKKILWVAAVLALIATPAVIGLVALRGDDGSSSAARRAGALVQVGAKGGGAGYQLVIPPITPSGQAIEVQSFSWGVRNAGGTTYSGATAGKAQFNDLVIVKQIDQTSALFAQHVANGKHLQSAVLTLFKATSAGPVEYAKYTLTDVLVGSATHSGNADAVPTEEVSLNYATIKADVSTVNSAGTKTGIEQFSWNLAEATAQ